MKIMSETGFHKWKKVCFFKMFDYSERISKQNPQNPKYLQKQHLQLRMRTLRTEY